MARLRLGYTKSRSGCLRCKQRRVKCDETKPSCRACVRHGVQCSLSAPPAASPPAPGPPAAGSPSSGPVSAPHAPPTLRKKSRPRVIRPSVQPRPDVSPPKTVQGQAKQAETSETWSAATPTEAPAIASPDPFPYLSKFVTGPAAEHTANWVFDLELLHHFTTATYKTFQIDPARTETERLWQVEVPKQAFLHTFLLHLVLAISSYHLAYLHPRGRQTYALRASQHQDAGIRGMRIALARLSPANCHALFASSALLFIGSLAASFTSRTADGPTVNDLVDVLILVKGIGSVLFSSQELLRSGPLSALFVQRDSSPQPNPGLDRVVLAVGDFLLEVAETETDRGVRDIVHADAYRLVSAVRDSRDQTSVPEYRVVAAWPIQMSDGLIPLLRRKNQPALALLSYYCVIFHAAELQGYWYMHGWATGVIRDISKIMGDGPWKKHSAWALGWITGHAAVG